MCTIIKKQTFWFCNTQVHQDQNEAHVDGNRLASFKILTCSWQCVNTVYNHALIGERIRQ